MRDFSARASTSFAEGAFHRFNASRKRKTQIGIFLSFFFVISSSPPLPLLEEKKKKKKDLDLTTRITHFTTRITNKSNADYKRN